MSKLDVQKLDVSRPAIGMMIRAPASVGRPLVGTGNTQTSTRTSRTMMTSSLVSLHRGAFSVAVQTAAARRSSSTRAIASPDESWISISGADEAVKKRTLVEGKGQVVQAGSVVEIDYSGTLVDSSWSPGDVVECWLKEQQGLEPLAPAFVEHDIDGVKLTDENFFTEEMIANELGVASKIQCKKIVMAARRLSKDKAEHPAGTEFDSSFERGPYQFTLGQGKAIRAMELAVTGMKVGERVEIICRSDYAYGKDGLRKASGDVIVPPFATLCFDITLVSAQQ